MSALGNERLSFTSNRGKALRSAALLYRQSYQWMFFYPLCTWWFNTDYYYCSETYQAVIKMESLQESVFVKHINGWLINILQQTLLYCTIIHRLIAMDKRVLHNAACYSFQEQSGAPPHVSLPNLRVSSWLMCNWLDEWVSYFVNPSKHCLIKRPLRLWLKTSKISFI